MQQVNVFIETSSRFRGNVERKCGYVLSTQLRTGKETREHFGRVTGTYHQAILLTMVDAPVSYTHLDVYKRQHPDTQPFHEDFGRGLHRI